MRKKKDEEEHVEETGAEVEETDASEEKEEAEASERREEAEESEETGETEAQSPQKPMDLERLVAEPTWKEMLLELVAKEQIDPWNIDIIDVADKYLARIRALQLLDLHIPANLILASSILLRFKSDALRFEEEEQVVESEVFIADEQPPVEVPMLSLRTRIPPKRRLSLGELVHALESVFEDIRRRATRAPPPMGHITITIPKYDIEERMNEILSRAQRLADKEGMLTFSSLLKKRTREEKINTLIPMLHLAQDNKLSLAQEKFFGEIFIHIQKHT
ncbi:MAG: segregation/condensation protein A [Candidatus Micrarchaeota archaeon]